MIILFPGGTGAGKTLEYFEQNFITRGKSEKPSVFGSNLFMVFVFLIYNPHSFRCSQPNISFNRFNNLFSFVTVKTLSFHWIIALRGFLRSSPSFFSRWWFRHRRACRCSFDKVSLPNFSKTKNAYCESIHGEQSSKSLEWRFGTALSNSASLMFSPRQFSVHVSRSIGIVSENLLPKILHFIFFDQNRSFQKGLGVTESVWSPKLSKSVKNRVFSGKSSPIKVIILKFIKVFSWKSASFFWCVIFWLVHSEFLCLVSSKKRFQSWKNQLFKRVLSLQAFLKTWFSKIEFLWIFTEGLFSGIKKCDRKGSKLIIFNNWDSTCQENEIRRIIRWMCAPKITKSKIMFFSWKCDVLNQICWKTCFPKLHSARFEQEMHW